MKIASAWSVQPDECLAATEAYEMLLEKLQGVPHFIFLHSSCSYDNRELIKRLRALAPEVPLQGGTSCRGVMTESGFHGQDSKGMGLLGVFDPDGNYGAGICESRGDPETATRSALEQALNEASRPGELPVAVVISSYPGHEERVIRAIEKYLGPGVPIIGGTTADNDMTGQWQQFADDRVLRNAVSIGALFPSGEVGYGFHSGYEPTGCRGRATRAEGRVLYEIDNRPAARVYNEWTEGLISDILPGGGSLVPLVSLRPLGRPVGQVGSISYFRLSYPVEALADEALKVFTEIKEGDEVFLMKGTHENLVNRAGRVAEEAVEASPFKADEIQGALVLFCTGCMLIVQDSISEVVSGLQSGLNRAPFLGAFTLGEQGCFIGGENRHGNLMIAVLVFGPFKTD
ncbi:MAG: FIST C-terminal domain-containing protein [Candidatus Glassbacteria bacterium]|nr:FIST C-terminal domain-containing protein [Candidatus Glassbacteria bacterium]